MKSVIPQAWLLGSLVALGALVASASAVEDGVAPLDPHVKTFLRQHCFACRDAEAKEGGVRFDAIESYRKEDVQLWTKMHEKLAAGEMPPKDNSQPDAKDKQRLLDWIVARQRATASGRMRRLNRRELASALRDVTGLSLNYESALPGDGAVDGFDTGADGLQDTADSTAQAMRVARRAVDGVRFLDPPPAVVYSADLKGAKDAKKAFDAWKTTGARANGPGQGRQGIGWLIEPKWVGDRGDFTFRIPPPADHKGVVRITLVVSLSKSREEIPNPRLWVEVGGVEIDQPEITAPADKPQRLVYEVQVDDLPIESKGESQGLTIALGNTVEAPYAIEGFENEDKSRPDKPVPGGTGLFRPAYDRRAIPFDEWPVPFVVLQQVEIEMDYVAAWPPAAWKLELGELKNDHETARKLLSVWIDRAWRRKTSDKERGRFYALYERLRGDGRSFDDALRAAFQAALMSSSFRFLAPPSGSDKTISQDALAARLSFMLWGAPPDNELRDLAAAGKLADPSVLDAQIERLLADERSDAFTRPFVTQWLEMGQPITIAMDDLQKQDFRFGRHLKASMQEETIAYVARLLAENRPARELVESDWTLMNDILARHYGYEGIDGGQLRKVTLRRDDPRGGGILGQAGIQSMLCWMGENWVIYRGAWTLRRILDDPPPPPPLEVPELVPSDAANRGKPFKELLEQHQQDTRCAVCHKSIDPLGFAFQNFDLSGRWRNAEFERYVKNDLDGKIEWRGEGKTRPVDSVGKLPRGEAFASFAECKQLIVEHYLGDVVRGLMKNWLLYGTGRKPDVTDLEEIRTIMEHQRQKEYPLRDMLKALLRSPAFHR